ncbi:polyribonucleotide nucleotidyltransferase [Thermanaerovibrio acidaminovorans]|jgi:polyribonucleotide nucleotidyltransferase|uniref:Polyribonucleotide nucleotidyltransferase n=1 Tax=Thermanaerovibrio acidaminovorans (strain ATCC 49978 / DSM 6589 / Su883) TaxID=525903 RepID=D1B9J9_THEAS|nr:polyribonucleotide nucleotidyltransferase [Thermanaerovibrio acidaminovorans]ACZ18952.1 Polyribonucleotide nucleotidyltransferase [Thermanaerovibrio acidaminovorans DSM 6589]
MHKVVQLELGGRVLSFETGRMAKQANGAVYASYGETAVLVTSVMSEKPREGLDFFPLLVDYEERFYSAGKIPGGFIKREGRPSETAILSGRMVDRSIRSLFPEHMRNDVHVVATVLSVDQHNPPNVLAINAASAALAISDIPWDGPIGAVRIGCIDGQLLVNPTEPQMAESTLDLLVAGHDGGITMVEAGANEVSEDLLVDAMELAHQEIRRIVAFIRDLQAQVGLKKVEIAPPARIDEIDAWIEAELKEEIYKAVQIHHKVERKDALSAITKRAVERFEESHPGCAGYVASVVEEWVKKGLRRLLLDEGRRADGRAMDQLRPITCEVGVLPKVHGSALFTRGETQALAVTTLGMMGEDDQILDGLKIDEPAKRFLLHYNFPPYSVGEVRPMRGPGRREIGHGALAERALRPMLPSEDQFPYVVRVVSDILESNGSSSMASVCGGSLSMMDAGVPIKKAVAGVAMGLVTDGSRVCILTDIQGLEDHYGDMDFKVAGTRDGVTALQMDNKAGGITREILKRALDQARDGRMRILDIMDGAIRSPRDQISPNAPRIMTITIDPDKIRDVIGPGGKTIRSIIAQTGAKVDVQDDGRVCVAAQTEEAASQAIKIISDLTREVQAGEIFVGRITRMLGFGYFVEVLPGKEGLLHVSEISSHHIPKIEDAFSIGDEVLVVVREIDDMNRINLSRRRLIDRYDQLAKDPALAAQVEVERAREIRYGTLKPEGGSPKGPQGRRDSDRRPSGGDRRDKHHR